MIDLCLPTQYRVKLDREDTPSIYCWHDEALPISHKISKEKLAMLRHLYT